MSPVHSLRPRRRLLGLLAVVTASGITAATVFVMSNQASAVSAPSGAGCADVHVITARASGERPGEGITATMVSRIVNASDQTVSRASVDYPATLANYARSSAQGVTELKAQLTAQAQQCPDQKIVLAGYSQGAHVVLDVLGGGGGGVLGAATPPIAASIANRVTAVATFGDPRHVAGQPFGLGTATRDGRFPRSAAQLRVLAGFADRIQTFCDARDTFCDSGASTIVHLTYMNRHKDAAADFVLDKVGG